MHTVKTMVCYWHLYVVANIYTVVATDSVLCDGKLHGRRNRATPERVNRNAESSLLTDDWSKTSHSPE